MNNTSRIGSWICVIICLLSSMGSGLFAESSTDTDDVALLKKQLARLEQAISESEETGDTSKVILLTSGYNRVLHRIQLYEEGVDPQSLPGLQAQVQMMREELSMAEQMQYQEVVNVLNSSLAVLTNQIARLQQTPTKHMKIEQGFGIAEEVVNVQQEAPAIADPTLNYSNSLKVIDIINLKTNYSAAIRKSEEIYGDGRGTSLWTYAKKRYVDMLSIALSGDELLEIINTYPSLTNENTLRFLSDLQGEAYRTGQHAYLLLNDPAFIEAAQKASNRHLAPEDRIRILDEYYDRTRPSEDASNDNTTPNMSLESAFLSASKK